MPACRLSGIQCMALRQTDHAETHQWPCVRWNWDMRIRFRGSGCGSSRQVRNSWRNFWNEFNGPRAAERHRIVAGEQSRRLQPPVNPLSQRCTPKVVLDMDAAMGL